MSLGYTPYHGPSCPCGACQAVFHTQSKGYEEVTLKFSPQQWERITSWRDRVGVVDSRTGFIQSVFLDLLDVAEGTP